MDIEYKEAIPGTGLMVFDCQSFAMSLSAASCATSFLRQQNFACMGCAVGRHHAGRGPLPVPRRKSYSSCDDEAVPLASLIAKKCARCGSSYQRLIAQTVCICCYNRQRECISGRNSKGKYPVLSAAKLRWVCALVHNDGDLERCFYPDNTRRLRDLGGVPAIERIEKNAYFVRAIATGVDELRAAIERVAPEAEIVDIDAGETLLEIHRRKLENA